MARLHIRCDEHLKVALQEVCDEYGVNMSQLMRGKIREIAEKEREAIPDEIYRQAKVEEIKEQSATRQEVAHLPNNLFQQIRRLIEKRFPLTPEEVKRNYAEPYKQQIQLYYDGDELARKEAQILHAVRSYKHSHPDTRPEDSEKLQNAIAELAFSLRKEESMDEARAFVKRMVNDGILPEQYRDETMDIVRNMNQDRWEGDWNKAVWGDLEA